jgi:DNA-directed RNA polymerase specialized sigma24 family protein
MDAFIDRVIGQFRKRVWELLVRGPGNASGARDEARRVHRQLREKDWRDLVRDPEAYVFLAVADVLQAFDSPRRADASPRADVAAPRQNASDTHQNDEYKSAIRPIVARLQNGLSDLSPLCRATLILHRRDKLSLEEIARRLHIQVPEAREHLKTGILHCAAGRLYNVDA